MLHLYSISVLRGLPDDLRRVEAGGRVLGYVWDATLPCLVRWQCTRMVFATTQVSHLLRQFHPASVHSRSFLKIHAYFSDFHCASSGPVMLNCAHL